MGGSLKNRVQFSTSLDTDNLDMLNELSEITRIPKSRLLDEALDDLFGKYHKILTEAQSKEIIAQITENPKQRRRSQ